MILRVKAVCLLTNCRPEELFEEGQGWTDSIPIKSDDYFELSNNMVFALDPMGEKEIDLVPKTLRNDSGSSCTIYVSYFDKDHTENNRQYSITLPPYGILRAVFTNRDLRKLAFVKGNISCADAERAIVQSGEENGIQLYYVRKLEKPLAFPHIEFYRDAAADAMGGAVILGSREFYSTVTSKTYLEKGKDDLPIRCFRSGRQWARLYSNGRLESEFVNDRELDGVTAVAEDGDRGLLICRKGEAYDYRGDGLSKPISLENFWDIMMERFSGDGCCETVRTQLTRFTVNKSRIKAESI